MQSARAARSDRDSLMIMLSPAADGTTDGAKPVTFTKDIAPIFQRELPDLPSRRAPPRRCRWSPTTKCGRGRSPSRNASRTRDMPPWHLDKTVGIRQYKNDRSLSDAEIATIVTWVDTALRRAIRPTCRRR